MKSKIRKKRNQMRTYPHDKIRGRLRKKGWESGTIDGVMKIGDDEIAVQTEVWNHETLGKELRLEDANVLQRRHEQHLKDTYDDRIEQCLLEKGWTLTERGGWYKPNWNPYYDNKDSCEEDEEESNPTIAKGCYATLRQAYRIQLKLDSGPEVEGLEESLEDLMLMSHSNEFGA